ncbi:Uncharacterized protein TCM_035034 [Theobroma cacao]|uniref:Uncharacterized protein n=1 Tax=Theobroma cacao TaxID=3641 RepID=A0A061FNX1_THECC|nr:Uncharacterized protein TCM_035034 [Theobroma cacao]
MAKMAVPVRVGCPKRRLYKAQNFCYFFKFLFFSVCFESSDLPVLFFVSFCFSLRKFSLSIFFYFFII